MAMTSVPPKRIGIPTKFNGTLGSGNPVSYDLSRGYPRIAALTMVYSIVRGASGAGAAAAPLVTDSLGDIVFRKGDKNLRVRSAAQNYGVAGVLAKDDPALAGHVVYAQAGVEFNGGVPVRIGSAADIALKATLANAITTATFYLVIPFVEYFRKEYHVAEMLGLYTADANGNSLGEFALDIDTKNQPGATASNGWTLRLEVEYDNLGLPAGTPWAMVKENRYLPTYSGVGDVELAGQIDLTAGVLDSISLLTAADKMSKVVVTIDDKIWRTIYPASNVAALDRKGYPITAQAANRIDIEFADNDDPTSALIVNRNTKLSIVATMATAADANKTVAVLTRVYGNL
jgi:hypothetical protein